MARNMHARVAEIASATIRSENGRNCSKGRPPVERSVGRSVGPREPVGRAPTRMETLRVCRPLTYSTLAETLGGPFGAGTVPSDVVSPDRTSAPRAECHVCGRDRDRDRGRRRRHRRRRLRVILNFRDRAVRASVRSRSRCRTRASLARQSEEKKYRANTALHFRDYAKPGGFPSRPYFSCLLKPYASGRTGTGACENAKTILTFSFRRWFAVRRARSRGAPRGSSR